MKESILFLNKLLKANDIVVLSLSGGPDSMALLNLLMEERKEKKLTLVACHVNHHVREESDKEESFVKKYCEDHNITFELLNILEYKDNFHNDARVQRYEFLKTIVNKYRATYLMTAHHGDDLIETILMRLERGSNIPGYAGFKLIKDEQDYQLVRPLIYTTKKEIIEYDDDHKIPFVVDKTNFDDDFTRNRIRKYILPSLKEENENIHLKYLKFSEEIYEYDNFIKNYIANIPDLINDNKLNITLYLKENEFMQRKILETMISNIQQNNELYIRDNNVKELIKLINSSNGKGTIDLPNGYIAIKEKKQLIIRRK